MHPKFSFASWNVRQFKGSRARLDEVDETLRGLDPDVFGLLEFEAKSKIRELMFDRFPEYDFAITDSSGESEIVIGYRRGMFGQVVCTQRREFQAHSDLRPGALASVNFGGEWFNLLYQHTDAGENTKSYRNRQAMFRKVWKLNRALKQASATRKANLLVLGDLNTMGSDTVTGDSEISRLRRSARSNGMRLLRKDHAHTWHEWGKGRGRNRRKLRVNELANARRSDLDHVIASNDLTFVAQDDDDNEVRVVGWQQVHGRRRVNSLWSVSDHCALYGELW